MGQRIEYEKGQELGPYHHIFIKEVAPYINPKTQKPHRRGLFKCSFCGKEFETRICFIKNGHTKSCGCQFLEASTKTIQEYNKTHPIAWNRKEYVPGQKVGDYGVIYLKEAEPKKHGQKHSMTRYGEFLCPYCGDAFVAMIENVSLNKTKACGNHNSLGEEKIAQLLNELSIQFETQKKYPDCGEQGMYRFFCFPFDFYLPAYNLCIEYDGVQHFKFNNSPSSWDTEDRLKEIQQHDELKTNYCLSHNIPLLRIPYTDFNKLTKEYLLEKIKESI